MTTDFDKFDAAMGTILKADPAKVKAEMEADKQERAKIRAKRGDAAPEKKHITTARKAWKKVAEAFKKNPKLQVPY